MTNNLSEEEIISKYNSLRQVRRDNKKSIVKKDGLFLTSVVYTDPLFAKRIVNYFTPQFKAVDTFLDPCAGRGAFYNALPEPKKLIVKSKKEKIFFNTPDSKCAWIFAKVSLARDRL